MLYTLNRDHIAASLALALAGLRSAPFERIRSAMEGWQIAPVHASAFGSAARGDGDTESDIDVFVVRPSTIAAEDAAWQAQIDTLAHDINRWTGNHAGISVIGGGWTRGRPPIVERTQARRDQARQS